MRSYTRKVSLRFHHTSPISYHIFEPPNEAGTFLYFTIELEYLSQVSNQRKYDHGPPANPTLHRLLSRPVQFYAQDQNKHQAPNNMMMASGEVAVFGRFGGQACHSVVQTGNCGRTLILRPAVCRRYHLAWKVSVFELNLSGFIRCLQLISQVALCIIDDYEEEIRMGKDDKWGSDKGSDWRLIPAMGSNNTS